MGPAGNPFLLPDASTQTAVQVSNGLVYLYGYQGGSNARFSATNVNANTAGSAPFVSLAPTITDGYYNASTSAINAIQLDWNVSGNFDGGTITLIGLP